MLAFWFTLDKKREFEIFLDGKAHKNFSKKIEKQLKDRSSKAKNKSNKGNKNDL